MPITRTAMVDDDGSGTTGTVINNAWKTELYDQIDGFAAPAAAWVDIPFVAGNFTGSASMIWTVASGNQVAFLYLKTGNTLSLLFNLQNTTVAGTGAIDLQIALPAGMVANKQVAGTIRLRANGTGAVGYSIIVAGGTQVLCRKVDHAPWAVSSGNNDVMGQLIIPLVAAGELLRTPLVPPDDPGLVLPA